MDYYLIAFQSANAAIASQKMLQGRRFSVMIMPTLRDITAHCGISLRVRPEEFDGVRQALAEDGSLPRDQYDFYTVTGGKSSPLTEAEA